MSRHFVLISLTLRPCPCPAAPCSCWLACFTLLFALVLQAALSSLALGAHRDGLRGLVPFRQPRTLLSVLSFAADVCSTSHRPAKFFGRVVFFERPFRAYEARCPDRSSPYVLPRGKHAVVTFGVLQSVATLLVHAVLWHLQWMSGAFLLPSFGQDLVASRARRDGLVTRWPSKMRIYFSGFLW